MYLRSYLACVCIVIYPLQKMFGIVTYQKTLVCQLEPLFVHGIAQYMACENLSASDLITKFYNLSALEKLLFFQSDQMQDLALKYDIDLIDFYNG